MIVFFCVVAALLACCDSAKLSEQQRKELQKKSSNNAWLLFTDKHKYYLLYRSNENDTAFEAVGPCVQISFEDCWHRRKELWYYFYYRGIYTDDKRTYNLMWMKIDRSSEQKDLVRMRYNFFDPEYKLYRLLFTDYQTCFTLIRLHDQALQVWILGTTNITAMHETCHSTYNKQVNETGGLTEIPKYYIYNETICGERNLDVPYPIMTPQ